jgi:hypothetical protein
MTKRKKRKPQQIPLKMISPIVEETSSSPPLHPNATLTPDASLDIPTGQWLSKDSTNAPEIGEKSEEHEEHGDYAGSHAALIDKYILSRHSIPFILAFIVIGYVFIQDNGAGKLTTWTGILWTIEKSGILLGLLLFILICQSIYKKIF